MEAGTKRGKMNLMVQHQTGWKDAPYLLPTSQSAGPEHGGPPMLSILLSFTTGLIDDSGYNNFGKWVEAAAKRAGG